LDFFSRSTRGERERDIERRRRKREMGEERDMGEKRWKLG